MKDVVLVLFIGLLLLRTMRNNLVCPSHHQMNFSIIRLSSENENPKNENTEHRLEPRTTEDDGDGQLDLPLSTYGQCKYNIQPTTSRLTTHKKIS